MRPFRQIIASGYTKRVRELAWYIECGQRLSGSELANLAFLRSHSSDNLVNEEESYIWSPEFLYMLYNILTHASSVYSDDPGLKAIIEDVRKDTLSLLCKQMVTDGYRNGRKYKWAGTEWYD